MSKNIQVVRNGAGGVDLITERDAGNKIRILTGNAERSYEFWNAMLMKCNEALREIEAEIETEDAGNRLCPYHQDNLEWDTCSEGFEGCEVEEVRRNV